jgi:hypothetical protein
MTTEKLVNVGMLGMVQEVSSMTAWAEVGGGSDVAVELDWDDGVRVDVDDDGVGRTFSNGCLEALRTHDTLLHRLGLLCRGRHRRRGRRGRRRTRGHNGETR